MINLSLFDLDGLLVDSQTVMWMNSEIKSLNSLGYKEDEYFLHSIEGTGASSAKKLFLEKYGDDFNYEEYLSRVYKENKRAILNNEVPVKKGAFELLDYLYSKNIPMSLGSSSKREYVIDMLKSCGLEKYFSSIVTGSDVKYAKPSPDIYLKCLSNYNVPKSETVIFEDAHSGLRSGMAAHIRVILVPGCGILEDTDYTDAYRVIDDLSQAIEIIEKENETASSI